jgi:hypothetical protein
MTPLHAAGAEGAGLARDPGSGFIVRGAMAPVAGPANRATPAAPNSARWSPPPTTRSGGRPATPPSTSTRIGYGTTVPSRLTRRPPAPAARRRRPARRPATHASARIAARRASGQQPAGRPSLPANASRPAWSAPDEPYASRPPTTPSASTRTTAASSSRSPAPRTRASLDSKSANLNPHDELSSRTCHPRPVTVPSRTSPLLPMSGWMSGCRCSGGGHPAAGRTVVRTHRPPSRGSRRVSARAARSALRCGDRRQPE